MRKKILFIEDNKTKSEAIKKFISENFDENFEIIIKESLTSGLRELFLNEYDILLVDMSLPTRDDFSTSFTNNHEQLGGHRIMSEMKRKKLEIPTILITMFAEFGINESFMNIKELNLILNRDFSEFYKGYVYYSSKEENWKDNLKLFLKNL
jgi:CheY-like chemotaxis protein